MYVHLKDYYLEVTIVCRYIFLLLWLERNYTSTEFAICMWKWCGVDKI